MFKIVVSTVGYWRLERLKRGLEGYERRISRRHADSCLHVVWKVHVVEAIMAKVRKEPPSQYHHRQLLTLPQVVTSKKSAGPGERAHEWAIEFEDDSSIPSTQYI